jgi:hypothetical protein
MEQVSKEVSSKKYAHSTVGIFAPHCIKQKYKQDFLKRKKEESLFN